jgi:hypothetical protein
MAQFPQFNDSQNSLLAKIAANTGESQPKVGDGQHNLLFKIAQNTYASAVNGSGVQEQLDEVQSELVGKLNASSDNYVLAQPSDDLVEKYAEAKAKSPSATNRITLFIVPGTYPLSSELAIDAEYVDLVGLGAQFQSPAVIVSNNTLNVTANDVRVSGISVGAQTFKIADDKPLQVFENCVGGDNSFGIDLVVSGKFTNCVGGEFCFGGGEDGTASGVFINCVAGLGSFGGAGVGASGKFTNCIGGAESFGFEGIANGIFVNCISLDASFGGGGLASGKFVNCAGGRFSFGGEGVFSGELISCRLIDAGATYETPTGSGIIRFCLDGDNNIVNADEP